MRARVNFTHILATSIAIRIALICYSEWYDARPETVVKYTDIDYRVFTDAARYVVRESVHGDNDALGYRDVGHSMAKGPLGSWLGVGDPYDRDTYRYTPLLAVLMAPNILFFHAFGKYLFAACDILVGLLLRRILVDTILPKSTLSSGDKRTTPEPDTIDQRATLYAAIHLLNPLVFSISTRGSSESIIGALVVATLHFALTNHWDLAAVILGVAAHWKIYPIVYGASLVAVLASPSGSKGGTTNFRQWVGSLVNRKTVRFAVVSGGTFMVLNLMMYLVWGEPFLQHSFLYHLHRLDHRHNFSPFFLPIYLSYPPDPSHPSHATYISSELTNLSLWSKILRSPLASFVPQMGATLGTGFILTRPGKLDRLPFVWFVQTAVFVTLNKVCTSQYFLWYLTLLPLLPPSLHLSRRDVALLLILWPGAQAAWLKYGYELEFLGRDVYFVLWMCSMVFLAVNVWAIGVLMKGYMYKRS